MHKSVKLYIRHSDVGPNGLVTRAHPWRPANSLLKAFLQVLTMFLTAENQTITLVNNTPTLLTPDAGLLNIAATSQQNKGIVIGTGSDAVTKVDHCLQTPATSSIVYGTQTFEIVNPDPADWHTLIHRGFTNNSAASLAVEEIGMIAYPGSYANYVLLDRTLYPLTIEIGETKIITYKIQI